jgi:hypothetical protein
MWLPNHDVHEAVQQRDGSTLVARLQNKGSQNKGSQIKGSQNKGSHTYLNSVAPSAENCRPRTTEECPAST